MRSTSRLPVMIEYLRCFDVGEQPVREIQSRTMVLSMTRSRRGWQ